MNLLSDRAGSLLLTDNYSVRDSEDLRRSGYRAILVEAAAARDDSLRSRCLGQKLKQCSSFVSLGFMHQDFFIYLSITQLTVVSSTYEKIQKSAH